VKKQPTKNTGSPYKVLYWMGGALAVLLLGVVALIMLAPGGGDKTPADPERTVLWLYDEADPAGPAAVAIIEESRSQSRLLAVPFSAPEDARKAYGGKSSKKGQEALAALAGRELHHRVFMPYSVVETLINAAGRITVEGQKVDGASAIAYIKAGGEEGPVRVAQVMMGLAQAVSVNGVAMSTSEGLKLARLVDTDIDLLAIPDMLGRWSEYVTPRVERPEAVDTASLQKLLLPDASQPK
jgi:hypothetical protein